MGRNPQESFAKMDEDRNVENGVGGQMMHLNPPMVKEAPKQENQGPEEHKEGKQQIRFHPHEEKIPPWNHANGSLSGVEEDVSPQDPKDGSHYTYSTYTRGHPPHQRQHRPPSPSKQISSAPLEQISLTSRSGASGG